MSELLPPNEPELDALLVPVTAAPFASQLRQRLLETTARRVRYRGHIRRIRTFVALAVMFVAGLLVRGFANPGPEVMHLPPPPQAPETSAMRLSPAELEQQAEGIFIRAESARRFREAGDGYLAEFGDLRGALRCYCNFLDEADQTDLAESDSDSWLLASLKKERLKETNNADGAN